MISLLHPSRSRPDKAFETARKWLDNAGCDVEYILSLDDDDDSDYHRYFGKTIYGVYSRLENETSKWVNMKRNPNSSAIDAINNAAKVSSGNILIVLSDDFDCPPLWGKKILDATQGKTDWILKTPDGIQKWIITMPIMDRAYYDRFGYVYYPDYLHMFCDTELSCVADLTGRKIEASIPFVHNHYSIGKTEKDAVSIKADATWAQGEKLFLERYKKNFDLTETPGRITSPEYLNWIKRKL